MKSILYASIALVSIFAASGFIAATYNSSSSSSRSAARADATTSAADEEAVLAGKKEVATLAGGCFWCMEAVFNDLRGVEKVVSGFSGGRVANPSYEEVCTGRTGHAEVVNITFDPQVISFKELLEVFFTVHDPTTLNRQGADEGTQYRSAIFYHSPEQKAGADAAIAEINAAKIWNGPIVTEVTKFSAFYPAEEYHQRYYERNPNQGYCRIVIEPKVIKFRKQFLSKLKKQPADTEH